MNIYEHIDYTLLKATATYNDIWNLCEEAKEKGCASVCIPSCYVPFVHEHFPTLTICTVVGFPLGNSSTATKVAEAIEAVENGANEIDMVINIAHLKHGLYYAIESEIEQIREAIGYGVILKVIIETCYLTEEEIAIATILIDKTSADYVKTSTGFGSRGASFEDILIIKENICGNDTKIKASGGIRTKEDMMKYIALGCDRIGASKLP